MRIVSIKISTRSTIDFRDRYVNGANLFSVKGARHQWFSWVMNDKILFGTQPWISMLLLTQLMIHPDPSLYFRSFHRYPFLFLTLFFYLAYINIFISLPFFFYSVSLQVIELFSCFGWKNLPHVQRKLSQRLRRVAYSSHSFVYTNFRYFLLPINELCIFDFSKIVFHIFDKV